MDSGLEINTRGLIETKSELAAELSYAPTATNCGPVESGSLFLAEQRIR